MRTVQVKTVQGRAVVRPVVRAVQVRAAAAGAEQGPGNRTVALAPWTLS